jgi:hypothetical protein
MGRKYKQKSLQRASIDRADHHKHRNVALIGAERAKAFRGRRRPGRESACQPSASNAATTADSLMELHVEMRAADTDINVDEPPVMVGGPTHGTRGTAPTRELWK